MSLNIPTKEFVQLLSNLKSVTGGTSLITLYIPAGYSLGLITKKLSTEMSTGTNIKDKNVSKAVMTALNSSLQAIKNSKWHNAPENGLVLIAGETEPLVVTPTTNKSYV